MILDGLFGDIQAIGNPFIGIAGGHESGYFVFPLGKRLHEAKLSSEGPCNSNREQNLQNPDKIVSHRKTTLYESYGLVL